MQIVTRIGPLGLSPLYALFGIGHVRSRLLNRCCGSGDVSLGAMDVRLRRRDRADQSRNSARLVHNLPFKSCLLGNSGLQLVLVGTFINFVQEFPFLDEIDERPYQYKLETAISEQATLEGQI